MKMSGAEFSARFYSLLDEVEQLAKDAPDDSIQIAISIIEHLSWKEEGRTRPTPHWERTKNRARHYAGMRCQGCGARPNRLITHHNTYAGHGRGSFNDVIVVCAMCHGSIHAGMNKRDRIRRSQSPHDQLTRLASSFAGRTGNSIDAELDPQ